DDMTVSAPIFALTYNLISAQRLDMPPKTLPRGRFLQRFRERFGGGEYVPSGPRSLHRGGDVVASRGHLFDGVDDADELGVVACLAVFTARVDSLGNEHMRAVIPPKTHGLVVAAEVGLLQREDQVTRCVPALVGLLGLGVEIPA